MRELKIIEGKQGGALKTVLYGPEGIGKSTLASRFPRPLFIDTEGSTRHMHVSRTEKPTSWTMLLEMVQYIRDNPHLCGTLVIDTADWAEQLCIANICATKKLSGIEDMGYGKGYVYLAEEFGRLLNLLEELVERGVHVVLTAHAKMRKFEQPDEMGAYDRWELKLQQKTGALVKEWSDLLLFANYKTISVAADDKGKKFKAQGGRRVMYTTHHPCWDAKNRLGLPEELPLDYAPLAQYFEPAAPTAPVAPVTPPEAPEITPPKEPEKNSEEISEKVARERATNGQNQPTIEETFSAPGGSGALAALRDLMKADGILDYQVQACYGARGYFPEDTPLENLPEEFVSGWIVALWPQVKAWIAENNPLPF